MKKQAQAIVAGMQAAGIKRRLIFISSMGISGEVPGESYRSVLDPYRDSAAVIVSLASLYVVALERLALVRELVARTAAARATTPGLEVRQSLGVSTP